MNKIFIFLFFAGLSSYQLTAQELWRLPQGGTQSRVSSMENLNGVKGKGGMSNKGAKGSAFSSLKAGETKTLLDLQSSGIIRRMWFTIDDRNPVMLRALRLRMYWDGASQPAVDVPFGDFFCTPLGRPTAFQSALFSNPEGRSFNCYIAMPFKKAARITLTNESGADLSLLFFDIDFEQGNKPLADQLYFHAFWHRQRETPVGQDLEILPLVRGKGRFLGASVGVNVNPAYDSTWWGEGEVKMYIDGDKDYPTINGTGAEDYIGTGWGEGSFAHQYQGCLLADGKGRQYAFYRFHIPDPIWFEQDFKATIQEIGGGMAPVVKDLQAKGIALKPVSLASGKKGFRGLFGKSSSPGEFGQAGSDDWMNFYRTDDYAVTAYFYLDSPANGLNSFPAGSFAYDLAFIRKHDSSAIVLQSGEAKLLVSPKYQAKVFTSTATGDKGPSFGWIHYKAFEGPEDPHMNAYGGENRLWLGPEGGKFSLFFPKGAQMEFANWKTPAAFDTEPWQLTTHTGSEATFEKNMQLTNYAGTLLDLSITRRIRILGRAAMDTFLQLDPDNSVHAVAYQTENILTNKGSRSWTEATGMPCLWLLDMLNPSPNTTIIIPYAGDAARSKPATTDYFGEIPADRIKFQDNGKDGILFFKADGNSRGKLGIHPLSAKRMAGSYDALHGILTVTLFDTEPKAKYLNQEWNTMKPPFSGDAVNAYNDGPLAAGSQMGPFYELESVSPAAFLAPGASMIHHHSVFHFTGPEASLDKISRKLWGLSLDKIKKTF